MLARCKCVLFTAFFLKGLHPGYVLFTVFSSRVCTRDMRYSQLSASRVCTMDICQGFTAFCLKGLHHGCELFTAFCHKGYPLSMLVSTEFLLVQELHRTASDFYILVVQRFNLLVGLNTTAFCITAFCLQDLRSGFVNITNSLLKVGCTKGKSNLQFSSAGYDLSTAFCLKCGSLGMYYLQLSAASGVFRVCIFTAFCQKRFAFSRESLQVCKSQSLLQRNRF
jgi:hypothetical protein